LRICFVASEVAPLAKTGGLADVAGALPRYLKEAGHDVRLVMPLYSSVDLKKLDASPVAQAQNVAVNLGTHQVRFSVLVATLPGTTVPVYLLDCPAFYGHPELYGNAPDEHLRFLLLQRGALELCQRLAFAPDIFHCNDWHTALAPLLLKTAYAWDRNIFAKTRTVLTIHNIGYQGQFSATTLNDIGADVGPLLTPADLARGQVNWLREGVRHADAVTTVSPTYALEIQTPSGGYGLDSTIRERSDAVVGILNGVDYAAWNPATDRYLKVHYTPDDLAGKRATKAALLDRFNLPNELNHPLIGIVSRMTVQKGFDLLFRTMPDLLIQRDFKLLVLGNGEARYEDFFADLERRFPDCVGFYRGYSDEIAHLIEAGADMFLMPSLYEPCGLNQMYSLKYGTVPIVRRTGGLADSVQHWDPVSRTGTGIVFNDYDANAIRWALDTALDLYKDQNQWRQLIRNGMAQNFSWDVQGTRYEALYHRLTR
jgi:starch synthase